MDSTVKCACEHCSCQVDTTTAIEKDGRFYCDESCANGHVEKASCGHAGCNCG
jgi:hypothetical protein